MTEFKKGASGDDVVQIQKVLQKAGFYAGDVDGLFGDGTETSVKNFQSQAGLTVDGIVGPDTWARLFPETASTLKADDLSRRCLALTGSFETSRLAPDCFAAVTGNFDGQGMSFGALQWNFGQETLQPLFQEMLDSHPELSKQIFGKDLEQLQRAIKGGKQSSLLFAASIQDQTKKTITASWKNKFRTLGLTPEFQSIETKGAAAYYGRAVQLFKDYNLWSVRGLALMFDIAVQNGSISAQVRNFILDDVGKLDRNSSDEEREVAKMRIIAQRRAEAANPNFIEDVRRRKLCIAEGKGVVHGITYDLALQFGITLNKADLRDS